jgi:hypothetical protein
MDKFNTTIVSGFLSDINKIEYRSLEKYVEYGKKLIQIKLPKVIFIDKKVYQQYFLNVSDELTKFIEIEKKDIYLYEHIDKLTDFKVNTDNPNKDTLEYMFVQNHKTEWIKQAIHFNFFNTSQYIWVDFGVYHLVKQAELFEKCIYKIGCMKYDNIRMPGCWDLHKHVSTDIYHNIAWYFAGSIFGGHKDKLLEFADLVKEKCLYLINNKKYLMWEVNVWYLVFIDLKDKNLIDWYNTIHSNIMLLDY